MMGTDGANLVEGRETLFDRAFPAGTKIVTETHVEERTRKMRVRIYRESSAKRVDVSSTRRA